MKRKVKRRVRKHAPEAAATARKKAKKAKTWLGRHWKDVLIDLVIVGFVMGLVLTSAIIIWISTLEIPDLSAFDQRRVLQSTKIYDRTGEILLFDLHEDVKRTIVPFDEISRHVKNATIAIEDDQFYNHIGIDFEGIFRAAVLNLRLLGGQEVNLQGGSTITQQVIKNSVLEQDRTLTRKVKEIILSIKLEGVLEKDEILSHYLNESPYGGTIYGVEEASQLFFGKSASEVTLAEAAYLAALPQAPTRYSPYGNNRDLLDGRQKIVLSRMLELGFITDEEYVDASAEEVFFLPQSTTGIRAPHFVMYVREILAEKYGETALAERGYRVITSLNYDWQEQAEEIVKRKAFENVEKFNASNAGLVAVDPQTGDILTMVGSRDYFDEEIDGNFNIALASRQPGSSIKPMVYASAFEKGYTPETILYDVQTQFGAACNAWDTTSDGGCYSPNNYNFEFVGPISMRNALAQSLNIPAVKTLYLTGLGDAIKLTTDLGITTLNDPDRLGLTLVLGGGEVKLLEHTGAYGVFANEGVRATPRPILRIEDVAGTIVEDFEVLEKRVLSRDAALQVADVLSDNVARTPLWGSFSAVNFGNRDVAVKSGSTNNLRDAWIMGFTPNLAVGAWVGNNDNAEMGGGLSGLITTPMWREFMDVAVADIPVQSFAQPSITSPSSKPVLLGQTVDANVLINDLEAGGGELNIGSLTAGMHSILHFVHRHNPNGPYPVNPALDSQYENWEYAVTKWKEERFGALIAAQQALASSTIEVSEDEDEDDRDSRRRR